MYNEFHGTKNCIYLYQIQSTVYMYAHVYFLKNNFCSKFGIYKVISMYFCNNFLPRF